MALTQPALEPDPKALYEPTPPSRAPPAVVGHGEDEAAAYSSESQTPGAFLRGSVRAWIGGEPARIRTENLVIKSHLLYR